MVLPELALAPEIDPILVPIVQLKVLVVEAPNAIPGPTPLQVVAVAELVPTGVGFAVTVIVYVLPEQSPAVDVGVIKYLTVPAVELLGFTSTSFIPDPEPEFAPVIPPVIPPKVHT